MVCFVVYCFALENSRCGLVVLGEEEEASTGCVFCGFQIVGCRFLHFRCLELFIVNDCGGN